jgi:hypothetical protein
LIEISNGVMYKAFGLNVLSEIPLPELVQNQSGIPKNIDIVIKTGDLELIWNELSGKNKGFIVEENHVMFNVPGIAIFSIKDSDKITVSIYPGSDEEVVRLYTLGTCMGAILMQRKTLPLHGSAVAIDGKAYALVGNSGVGKSTLASVFLKEGYQLLSDDVIAVNLENDIPIISPAYPQQKLWQQTLEEFGKMQHNYRPIYQRETKFAVPVFDQFTAENYPLAGVFELDKGDIGQIELKKLSSLQSVDTFFKHTYRNFLISGLGLVDWHFNTSIKVLNHVETYQICRPKSVFTATHLYELILKLINKE